MLKKSFFFTLTLSLISVIMPIDQAKANFPMDIWPYFKNIEMTEATEQYIADVTLDDELLTQVQDSLRDVRVVDSTGNEVSYNLKTGVSRNKAVQSEIKEVLINDESVDLKSLNTNELKDDNKKSYTKFVNPDDTGINLSILFDLKEKTVLDKAVIFSYFKDSSYNTIEVLGSNDGIDFKVVRPRVADDYEVWRWYSFIKNPGYQYYQVNFQGQNELILNEVMLLTPNNGTIQFVANAGENYRLFYGYGKAPLPEYKAVEEGLNEVQATLGNQQRNTTFNQDIDRDGIVYRVDNCPEIANADQKDGNDNGVGDLCEYTQQNNLSENTGVLSSSLDEKTLENEGVEEMSTPEFKAATLEKTNVNDRDSDQINNIFDNCADIYNPNQADGDKDGIGDLCDRNENKDFYSQILVGVLIFICIIIVFSIIRISFKASRRSKNNELPTSEKGKDQIFSEDKVNRQIKKKVSLKKTGNKKINSKMKKSK